MASDRAFLAALGATLIMAIAASNVALAGEPSSSDKETARGLMRQGDAELAKGDTKAAVEAYRAAHAIMGLPTTGLALARAQATLGLLVEARDNALAAARHPEASGSSDVLREAARNAAELAGALAPRIPAVRVRIANMPPGRAARVAVDGEMLPEAAVGQPRRVNPGRHRVVASADGFLPAQAEVDVQEGQQRDVELRLAVDPRAPAGGAATRPWQPDRSAGDSGDGGFPVWGFVGFGVAGAGAVAGTITGLFSIGAASDIEDRCGGTSCPPAEQDELDRATTLAHVSTVAFVVGGAGLAVGIVSLLIDRSPRAAATTTLAPHARPTRLCLAF